jgi:hemolysin III
VSAQPSATEPRVKPSLRGVSHQIGFFVALPLGVLIALESNTARGHTAAIVFATSVATMFGASSLYHRVNWSPTCRLWMRRVDHAGIFGLIAGTYTPFGLLVLDGAWSIVVLAVVWGGTAAAVLMKFVWVGAPKWLGALIAVALGWVGVVVFPQLLDEIGVAGAMLVLAGGVAYTAGAVIYAVRRPDPLPAVFGYHELFHALVVVAVACQYVAVAFFVLPDA